MLTAQINYIYTNIRCNRGFALKYYALFLLTTTLSSYALPTYLSFDSFSDSTSLLISPSNNIQLGGVVHPFNAKNRDTQASENRNINQFSIQGVGYYVMRSKVFSAHPICGCYLNYNPKISITNSNNEKQKQYNYTINSIIGLQYRITNRLLVNFEHYPVSIFLQKTIRDGRSSVYKQSHYNRHALRFLYQLV